jgi:signal peptidase I
LPQRAASRNNISSLYISYSIIDMVFPFKNLPLMLPLSGHIYQKISRELFCELLQRGETLTFKALGSSMGYIIREADLITVKQVNAKELQRGDIILCGLKNNLLCHRIIKLYKKDNQLFVITKGDVLLQAEQSFPASKILGKIYYIQQGSKSVNLETRFARGIGYCSALYSKSISYLYGRCGFYQQTWGNPQNSTLPIWMRRSIERALRLPIKILTSLLIITSRSHKILS